MTINTNMITQQTIATESYKGSPAVKSDVPESADHKQQTQESSQQLTQTLAQLQSISDILGRKVQFNVNNDLQKVVIKIIDLSTDKVIKEIPSAEVQKMQIRMRDAFGLLIDELI